MAAVLSLTAWVEATAPLGLIAFAAAVVGIVCGVLGLKSVARRRALGGLVLSALTVAAWFAAVSWMASWPEP